VLPQQLFPLVATNGVGPVVQQMWPESQPVVLPQHVIPLAMQ